MSFYKPFDEGFTRELVNSYQGPANNRFRICVYYRSPGPRGKRLRSFKEVAKYLEENGITNLQETDFTFTHHPIHKPPFETQVELPVSPKSSSDKSESWCVVKTEPVTPEKMVIVHSQQPPVKIQPSSVIDSLMSASEPSSRVVPSMASTPTPTDLNIKKENEQELEEEFGADNRTADQVAMMSAYRIIQQSTNTEDVKPEVSRLKQVRPIGFITSVTPDPEISSSSDGLEGVKIEAVKSIRSSKYNSTITVTPQTSYSSTSDGLDGVIIEGVKSIRASKYNSTVTVQPKPTSSVHSFEGIKIKKENAYSPEKTQSGIYIDNAEDTFVQGESCTERKFRPVKSKHVYVCHMCQAEFLNQATLKCHLVDKHSLFMCSCGETFKSQIESDSHIPTCEKLLKNKSSTLSGSSSRDGTDSSAAKSDSSQSSRKKSTVSSNKSTKNKKEESPESFVCKVCQKEFRKSANLMRHITQSHKKLQCLECNILFVTEGKLKEHVQAKHKKKPTDKEKNFKCEKCGIVLPSKSGLCRHEKKFCKVNSKQKQKFKCSKCPKGFNSNKMLSLHMNFLHKKTKDAINKIRCICRLAYADQQSLVQHQKTCITFKKCKKDEDKIKKPTPKKDKTFHQCAKCNISFVLEHSLKEHLFAIHNIGDPLKCNNCLKGFRWKHSLKAHAKVCKEIKSKKKKKNEVSALLEDSFHYSSSSSSSEKRKETSKASSSLTRRAANISLIRRAALARKQKIKSGSLRTLRSRSSSETPPGEDPTFISAPAKRQAAIAGQQKIKAALFSDNQSVTTRSTKKDGAKISSKDIKSVEPSNKKSLKIKTVLKETPKQNSSKAAVEKTVKEHKGVLDSSSGDVPSSSKQSISSGRDRKAKKVSFYKEADSDDDCVMLDDMDDKYVPPLGIKGNVKENVKDIDSNQDVKDVKPINVKPIANKAFSYLPSTVNNSDKNVVASKCPDPDSFRLSSGLINMLIKQTVVNVTRLTESEIKKWTEVIKIDSSDDDEDNKEDDGANCKKVSVLLGNKEIKIRLPVDLLRSSNQSSHPELRTLYLGTAGGKTDWLKVVGKSTDAFQYQCFYCQEAHTLPKDIAAHMTENHQLLKETVGENPDSIKGKTGNIFMSCRHCNYISMQRSVMWHHMQTVHEVSDILLPEAVPDQFVVDRKTLNNFDQRTKFYCPAGCDFAVHQQQLIIEHLLASHRYSSYIKPGFIRVTKAKCEPTSTSMSHIIKKDPTPPSSEMEEIYMCILCKFVAYKTFLMEMHCVETHSQKFLLCVCDHCGEHFLANLMYDISEHFIKKHNGSNKIKVSVTVVDAKGREDIALVSKRDSQSLRKKSSVLKKMKLGNQDLSARGTSVKTKPVVRKMNRPCPKRFKSRAPVDSDNETTNEKPSRTSAKKKGRSATQIERIKKEAEERVSASSGDEDLLPMLNIPKRQRNLENISINAVLQKLPHKKEQIVVSDIKDEKLPDTNHNTNMVAIKKESTNQTVCEFDDVKIELVCSDDDDDDDDDDDENEGDSKIAGSPTPTNLPPHVQDADESDTQVIDENDGDDGGTGTVALPYTEMEEKGPPKAFSTTLSSGEFLLPLRNPNYDVPLLSMDCEDEEGNTISREEKIVPLKTIIDITDEDEDGPVKTRAMKAGVNTTAKNLKVQKPVPQVSYTTKMSDKNLHVKKQTSNVTVSKPNAQKILSPMKSSHKILASNLSLSSTLAEKATVRGSRNKTVVSKDSAGVTVNKSTPPKPKDDVNVISISDSDSEDEIQVIKIDIPLPGPSKTNLSSPSVKTSPSPSVKAAGISLLKKNNTNHSVIRRVEGEDFSPSKVKIVNSGNLPQGKSPSYKSNIPVQHVQPMRKSSTPTGNSVSTVRDTATSSHSSISSNSDVQLYSSSSSVQSIVDSSTASFSNTNPPPIIRTASLQPPVVMDTSNYQPPVTVDGLFLVNIPPSGSGNNVQIQPITSGLPQRQSTTLISGVEPILQNKEGNNQNNKSTIDRNSSTSAQSSSLSSFQQQFMSAIEQKNQQNASTHHQHTNMENSSESFTQIQSISIPKSARNPQPFPEVSQSHTQIENISISPRRHTHIMPFTIARTQQQSSSSSNQGIVIAGPYQAVQHSEDGSTEVSLETEHRKNLSRTFSNAFEKFLGKKT